MGTLKKSCILSDIQGDRIDILNEKRIYTWILISNVANITRCLCNMLHKQHNISFQNCQAFGFDKTSL